MSTSSSTGSAKVDAIVAKAAAAPQLSGAALYSRFALAGALCCSITHGALTPVDVYVARAWLHPFSGPQPGLELQTPGRCRVVTHGSLLTRLRQRQDPH